MKKIYLLFAIILGGGLASAQSLQIMDLNYNNLTNGSYAIYDVDPTITWPLDQPVEVKFYVANTSGSAVDVFVKKVYINQVPTTADQFCWALLCYNPSTIVSTNSQLIGAHDTTALADVLKPQFFSKASASEPDFAGTVTIRYVAYVDGNPNDSAYIDVSYSTLASVENIKENNKISDFYPNPARDIVTFNYQIENTQEATLSIYDLTGSKVKDIRFNALSGSLKTDLSALKPGVYFYTFYVRGKAIATKRIVIAR